MKNLLAAFIFFTRLPFWRLRRVPSECFQHVVPWWPYVGWLTGGVMAIVVMVLARWLPLPAAWMLAIVVRLLMTGCLHEDGLADFCDGFGGGTTRERTLSIMKDSRIGTYGVVGLIIYFLLLWQLPLTLSPAALCMAVATADAWGKFCAAQLINVLPYARTVEQSKAKVVYRRMTCGECVIALVGGTVPLGMFAWHCGWTVLVAAVVPLLVFGALQHLMRRRLQGYTGDCCGATFLLCEMGFYLALAFTGI